MVEGDTVIEYTRPYLDNDTPLPSGYIALQAESAPYQFQTVELLNLEGCMDETASNYKTYHVKEDNSTCEYGGCMDPTACNYEVLAQTPCDGCCLWTDPNTRECTCETAGGCPLGIEIIQQKAPGAAFSGSEVLITSPGPHFLDVLNVNGELVHSLAGEGGARYGLSGILEAGLYFINLELSGQTFTRRLMVF
jgi:hypothetical protein